MGDSETIPPPDAKKRKLDDDVGTTPEATMKSDKEEEEYEKSERYYDESADLLILSSDNILLKIHSYHLLARSRIFRDMINGSTGSRLDLTDHILETEENLSSLLHLSIEGRLDADIGLEDTMLVIRLAKKYEFTTTLELIALLSEHQLHTTTYMAMRTLTIAAALDKPDLCAVALRHNGGYYGPNAPGVEEDFGDGLVGGLVQDPGSAQLDELQNMSPAMIWAWLRAHRLAFGPAPAQRGEADEKYKKMGDEFQRLMKLKDAPDSLAKW